MNNRVVLTVAASLLAFLAVSCVEEKEIPDDGRLPGEGLVFNFKVGGTDSFATKSTANTPVMMDGEFVENIALCEPDDPDQLFLTVTKQYIDDSYGRESVATKGTPVYTETFVDHYPSFLGIPYAVSEAGSREFDKGDDVFYCVDRAARQYKYAFDESTEWPEGEDLLFFLAAPTTLDGCSNFSYNVVEDATIGHNGEIEFDYTSDSDVYKQTDVVFTSRLTTQTEYLSSTPSDSRVLFYHALAGVKFKSKNAEMEDHEGNKVTTSITSIKVNNIYSEGHCKVVPTYLQEGYADTDSNTDFGKTKDVKKSRECVSWYGLAEPAEFAINSLKVVSNPAEGSPFPASFEGGKELGQYNLNDDDFAKTFMFIPQTTSDNVELTITYTLSNKPGQTFTRKVSFKGQKWEPGVLYTYTLNTKHVDLFIKDSMDQDHKVKSNLVIQNTGNVDAYFRVAIVGNWFDLHTPPQIVAPYAGTAAEGTFTEFDNTNWTKGDDGFYYYKYMVKPGEVIKHPLFSTFTVGECPNELYANTGHLQMDIMAQNFDATQLSKMSAFGWETGKFEKDVYDE